MENEAKRVAQSMAALRDERLHRLCGYSTSPHNYGASREPANLWRGTGKIGFSPFYYYPFLFATAFPSITVRDLRTLALANRVLLEAILLSDKKIDETRRWAPMDFYLVDCYYQKALETLIPLFPLDHDFWRQTEYLFSQHARAIIKEQIRHRNRVSRYTLEEFYEISTGKVALIKTNVLAMCMRSGAQRVSVPLMESQDRFLAGFQCFDDLRDWKEDLEHRNFTFLLTRVLFEGGFDHRVRQADFPTRADVGQVLYHKAIAEDQLRLAEQYFQEALHCVEAVRVPMWVEVVQGFLRHCHTMRHDLAEIRKRTQRGITVQPAGSEKPTDRVASEPIEARLKQALVFVVLSERFLGGYPLAQSPYPYMNPATSLTPSRLVTTLLLRALEPLQHLEPCLRPRLLKVSQWLAHSRQRPSNPCLPAALEEAFPFIIANKTELLQLDQRLDDSLSLRPNGLFWANMLYTASRNDIGLKKLKSLVENSIHQSCYTPWTHISSSEPPKSPQDPAACRPLLPLLLLCHALGTDLPQKPLHTYLLRRYRTDGAWNNPTETALSLLCLLTTDYHGPELTSAVEKLIRSQEPDGSWPPNAFYEQDRLFYGSRELTTAWCLLALFLWHLQPPLPREQHKNSRISAQADRRPETILHPGLPGELRNCATSTFEQLQSVLPPPWPQEIYVGHWPAMPAHFFLNKGQTLMIGVNVSPEQPRPVRATSCRPLNVEIVIAMMSGHRCLALAPLRDRLERIFVSGLALWVCGKIWPLEAPWDLLGMPKLDWAWCSEHEAFLWEELRRFLLNPIPKQPLFQWLLPDQPPSPISPIPKGAALFLGRTLFNEPEDSRISSRQVSDLLCKDLPAILHTFRRKVGLETNENQTP